MRKPTIYEVLEEKLGRAPTDIELKKDVYRILGRGWCVRCDGGEDLIDKDGNHMPTCIRCGGTGKIPGQESCP